MQKYRKLIAVIIGLIAVEVGPEYIPAPEQLTQGIFALLTAFGVWAVPNAPAPKEYPPLGYDR